MSKLNRRRFVALAGGASMAGTVAAKLAWAASDSRFAFVGSESGIHVFARSGSSWSERQVIASARPAALALSADGKQLYAVNAIESFGYLPRGTAEAYSVNPASGRLTLINRQALSLSGVAPKHLALSPDGKQLVVAIAGGGAYNLLPVNADGSLGNLSGILKETGSGPHPLQETAQPSMVAFDNAGHAVAVDLGADRVSVLSTKGDFRVADSAQIAEGSGPSSLAIDASGKRLFVAGALDGSVSSFAYGAGKLGARSGMVKTSAVAGNVSALALHPAGTAVYSSHGGNVAAWSVDATGTMRALASAGVKGVHTLSMAADGKSLVALTERAVVRMSVAADGSLGAPALLAKVANAMSVVLA